jgi:hypothetical protein
MKAGFGYLKENCLGNFPERAERNYSNTVDKSIKSSFCVSLRLSIVLAPLRETNRGPGSAHAKAPGKNLSRKEDHLISISTGAASCDW